MTSTKDWFASDDPHPRNDNARPILLPTIAELGRFAAAASAGSERYDKVNNPELPEVDGREQLLNDRNAAFRQLLVTFRAKTLSDATVQLYAGWCAAHRLRSEAEGIDETILYRVLLSVLPVVAAAAEMDLAEIGAGDLPDFVAREFPPEDG